MKSSKNLVLVLDDDELWHSFLATNIGQLNTYTTISAYTVEEAKELFEENAENIAVVAVDGILAQGGLRNTLDFVQWLKPRFSGAIIAMSSNPEARVEQMEAGCTHCNSGNDKRDIVIILKQLE